jgi:hypothetical protein
MTPGFGAGLVIETRSLPNSLVTTLATFTLVTRTARACASYLAALPSTRAIETRSLPASLAATPRGFAFYVAFPKSSIPDRDVFYVADPISSIPDLWQQEAVRALQQGKDPPSPRLRRDNRSGAGADRIGQDLHQSTSVTRDK